jgi:hypothetical protein
MASRDSAKSAQRAQFTISTQGIATHSQSQGSEAGASDKKIMSTRLKPPGTLSFSLARLCATQGSASAIKDALKEY